VPEPHRDIEVLAQNGAPLFDAGRPPFHLLLEIEARGECVARAGDDHGADAVVPLDVVHRLREFGQHRRVHCIGALGAGQRDTRDKADLLEADQLEHDATLRYDSRSSGGTGQSSPHYPAQVNCGIR